MEKLLFRGYDLNLCSASVLSSLCYKMIYVTSTAFFYVDTPEGVVTRIRTISKAYFNCLYKRFLAKNRYECAR